MKQARIHDWIRYVQENAENVELQNGDSHNGKAQNGKSPRDTAAIAAPPKRRVRQKPETRAELLERLINPVISLHEASILLNVCAATVRRYADEELLPHERTSGGQRRFRLRAVLALSRQLGGKRFDGKRPTG